MVRPGLNFQEKCLVPAGPQVFRFSGQLKYFREKGEKSVASKKFCQIGDPSGGNVEVCGRNSNLGLLE